MTSLDMAQRVVRTTVLRAPSRRPAEPPEAVGLGAAMGVHGGAVKATVPSMEPNLDNGRDFATFALKNSANDRVAWETSEQF